MLENLTERMEEEVLDKYKVEKSERGALQGGGNTLERERLNLKVERRLLGKNFLFVWRIQLAAFAKQTGGVNRRGGDEAAAKDGYHDRSDQENQIKRKDGCQKSLVGRGAAKAWAHTGWEDTMQKSYEWVEYMKRKDEKEKMEEMHQRKVEKMIKSAEGSAGLLHKITKPTMWRGV